MLEERVKRLERIVKVLEEDIEEIYAELEIIKRKLKRLGSDGKGVTPNTRRVG